ncbi:uncharacterized protein LOC127739146 [Mytilus californianus]|uniref:uncharacterized protein LOC127739146 n=1 Tax=Mytilus californianus TaxID=6549 RepID=UPI00224654AA|nr:uncharacterized protein LOC127739146 [Mytilus californianus]
MTDIYHGFELLLFKKFSCHPEVWYGLRKQIQDKLEKSSDDIIDINDIVQKVPQELWYLSVCLHRQPKRLIQLCKHDSKQQHRLPIDNLLTTYVELYKITEFHLDSIFKFREDRTLPKELFRCYNMRILSLKYNCLEAIPPDIGRLRKLQYLALTNNRLHIHSLPYTLAFCSKLKTILLDNNQLDALPGFLLEMSGIETVHRHGNHNYFKSTFMWYHTDVDFRIIPTSGTNVLPSTSPDMLQFLAAKTIIGTRKDFFNDPDVAGILKDYIADIYSLFNVCSHCNGVTRTYLKGYKVITFKNPYLGNTCVPFMHWTCSLECAKALEVPARQEQIKAAYMLDSMYEQYIVDCQRQFGSRHQPGLTCPCVSSEDDTKSCTIL